MSTGSTTPQRSSATLPSEFSDPAIQQLMSAGSVRALTGDEVREASESSRLTAPRPADGRTRRTVRASPLVARTVLRFSRAKNRAIQAS